MQHNPNVPNGAEAFYGDFEGFFKQNSESHVMIHHAIAEGDLVVLHLNSKLSEQDRGRAIVDIFRVEDGKIVEHFDVIRTFLRGPSTGTRCSTGTTTNRTWRPCPGTFHRVRTATATLEGTKE
ncbi:nuclear transport factor 2 family protein [Rubellimicrobium aerolatum]|uniref:Nuclear transport factor 2 family protein n=1 Tax=Rubellimicrobium aerolatum TaxID=490979 RepID=A0ABW0S821_9RHOB